MILVWSVRQGAYLRNKLYEICSMIYETFIRCNINKFRWNNARYETKNIICFMKYIWQNSFIVLREQTLHNFRHHCRVFCWFKQEDYNKLHVIYFLNVHRATNVLHAIYLWNIFLAICFIVFAPCLREYLVCSEKIGKIFARIRGFFQFFRGFPQFFVSKWVILLSSENSR